MKKRFLIVIIFFLIFASSANAQADNIPGWNGPANIISVDYGYAVSPLVLGLLNGGYGAGIGLTLEQYLTDHFSIGLRLGGMYLSMKDPDADSEQDPLQYLIIEAAPQLRIYPAGMAPNGLFIAAQAGYQSVSVLLEDATALGNIFVITPFVGCKFIPDDVFIFEFCVGWTLGFGVIDFPDEQHEYKLGGLTFSISMSWLNLHS